MDTNVLCPGHQFTVNVSRLCFCTLWLFIHWWTLKQFLHKCCFFPWLFSCKPSWKWFVFSLPVYRWFLWQLVRLPTEVETWVKSMKQSVHVFACDSYLLCWHCTELTFVLLLFTDILLPVNANLHEIPFHELFQDTDSDNIFPNTCLVSLRFSI